MYGGIIPVHVSHSLLRVPLTVPTRPGRTCEKPLVKLFPGPVLLNLNHVNKDRFVKKINVNNTKEQFPTIFSSKILIVVLQTHVKMEGYVKMESTPTPVSVLEGMLGRIANIVSYSYFYSSSFFYKNILIFVMLLNTTEISPFIF